MNTNRIHDGVADRSGRHLTEEEFGELMSAPVRREVHALSAAEAHVAECEQCAAELAELRTSLTLFRQATTSFANEQLRHLPACSVPLRQPLLQPMYFAAAAAVLLAALLPMQVLHHEAAPRQQAVTVTATARTAQPAESDEALLDDVNSEISASVPAPLQALQDPTSVTGSN